MSDARDASNPKKVFGIYPKIDWKETRDAHVFKVDLPGMKKEAVKLGMAEGRILEISGERKKEEEEAEKYHRAEQFQGSFLRRFRLPVNAKVDEAKAAMENGVLTVRVPKKPEPEPDPQPQFETIEISD